MMLRPHETPRRASTHKRTRGHIFASTLSKHDLNPRQVKVPVFETKIQYEDRIVYEVQEVEKIVEVEVEKVIYICVCVPFPPLHAYIYSYMYIHVCL